MSRINIVLLLLTVLLNGYTHASYIYGNNNMKVPDDGEATVDLQLIDNNEKHSSMIYVSDDCAKKSEICHTPFGYYKPCCPDTHCYCTVVNCWCSDNVYFNTETEDSSSISGLNES